ncbi:hypothetical protein GPK34_13110 [Secundilactobacillus kimchicus]|uniref:hypothetical protein n=1 Tax=Secundilactobacillus kimchicus TaxID=528209 RepID=UPI000704D572|nr:hypothetical protein [Secundilactobacillus kimchicus]MBT9672970.1 hypothetical protein [Secundilactobacillus kimchicus]
MIPVLNRTKQYLKSRNYHYEKSYIRPLMTPESVYVFKFGRNALNNRVIIRYSHTWTGRQRINEIDLRLHKQKHPRIFKTESDLLAYLESHLPQREQREDEKD